MWTRSSMSSSLALMVLLVTACPARDQREVLVVHEWGTFTSMIGSDGAELAGLHHQEEALPAFVYGRAPAEEAHKSLEGEIEGVTQKLETPVVYFYSPRQVSVELEVEFPQGIISEWYPDAASFEPAVGERDGLSDGRMRWRATVIPDLGTGGFEPVSDDSPWSPSRRVPSAPLRVGSEVEQFVFYRGLGAFATPLRVTSDDTGAITVRNESANAVPALFLLHVHEGGGALSALGQLGPGDVLPGVVLPGGKERDLGVFADTAGAIVAEALTESGLTWEEARAMVDTWRKSYFQQPGVRILYVLPRAWTDRLLPIRIAPEPSELVRTLVGRVEVLSPAAETTVVATVEAAALRSMVPEVVLGPLGRFAEPMLRRTLALLADDRARAYCELLITAATAAP